MPLLALLIVAWPGSAPAAAEQDVVPGDLRHGDLVRAEFSHGGTLEGLAVACDGQVLQLRVHGEVLSIDLAVVERLVRVQAGTDRTLPGIAVEADPVDPEQLAAWRQKWRHASSLAVGSFFVPGSGQFATGQPGLGVTYLIGTLLVDATLVLNIAINHEYVLSAVLGGIDLAARISSAALARDSALRMHAWCVPAPGGQPGLSIGFGFEF